MRRRAALLLPVLAPALLGGCGYRAMTAPTSARGGDPGLPMEIALVTDRDRGGNDRQRQLFRAALQANLRRSTATPRLERLVVSVNVQSQELVVRQDETPSRVRITATARFAASRVTPPGTTPLPPVGGTVVAVEAYNFIDREYFASDVAREAVETRLAEQLAERITEALTVAVQ